MVNKAFFAGITDPATIRKDLLHASKELVNLLIQHEHYLELRTTKKTKIEELRKTVNNLITTNKKLHNLLPQTEEAPPPVEQKRLLKPVKKSASAKRNRLDDLKDELSRFEAKISDLD